MLLVILFQALSSPGSTSVSCSTWDMALLAAKGKESSNMWPVLELWLRSSTMIFITVYGPKQSTWPGLKQNGTGSKFLPLDGSANIWEQNLPQWFIELSRLTYNRAKCGYAQWKRSWANKKIKDVLQYKNRGTSTG